MSIEIHKKRRNIIIGVIVLISLITAMIIFIPRINQDNTNKLYEDIDVNTAYNMINDTEIYPDLIILDVRTLSEYEETHINNSILIPHDELETRINELVNYKDVEIIVYCRSGTRSQNAVNILVSNNFTQIYNMLGGINAWIDAGYPTV